MPVENKKGATAVYITIPTHICVREHTNFSQTKYKIHYSYHALILRLFTSQFSQ